MKSNTTSSFWPTTSLSPVITPTTSPSPSRYPFAISLLPPSSITHSSVCFLDLRVDGFVLSWISYYYSVSENYFLLLVIWRALQRCCLLNWLPGRPCCGNLLILGLIFGYLSSHCLMLAMSFVWFVCGVIIMLWVFITLFCFYIYLSVNVIFIA